MDWTELTECSIETEENEEYLLQDILLKRYSIMIDGEQTSPANVIERAVDLHALRVTGSSGYQVSIFPFLQFSTRRLPKLGEVPTIRKPVLMFCNRNASTTFGAVG